MKKIITAVAAVAMAASMFAVDISASLKVAGSIFNIKTDGTQPTFLSLKDPAKSNHRAWSEGGITFSVNADKAGASFLIDGHDKDGILYGNYYMDGTHSLGWHNFKLYVKPTDKFQINLGEVGYSTHTETIGYSQLKGVNGQGFSFDLTPADGLKLGLALEPGYDVAWVTFGKAPKTTALYASYTADFGNIIGLFSYAPEKKLTFAAGYENTFDTVKMFLDANAEMDLDSAKAFQNISARGYVETTIEKVGIKAYVDFKQDLTKDANGTTVGACAKFTMPVDAATLYLKVQDKDFLANAFEMTINPGVTFNVGAASCDIGVNITAKAVTEIDVPFSVSVGF